MVERDEDFPQSFISSINKPSSAWAVGPGKEKKQHTFLQSANKRTSFYNFEMMTRECKLCTKSIRHCTKSTIFSVTQEFVTTLHEESCLQVTAHICLTGPSALREQFYRLQW